MSAIDDVIKDLTNDGEYANEFCLLMYLDDETQYLYYLQYLDIKGKDLEAFANNCIPDWDMDYIKQTIRYLCSGFLGKDEIKQNLESDKPIPFIDRLLVEGENIEWAYEKYSANFRSNLNNNKKR